MTTDTKHTPTPWVLALPNSNQSETSVYHRPPYGGGGYIEVAKLYEARENGGCNVPPQEAKANAAFIVRACNSHDALVAAIEEAIPDLEAAAKIMGYTPTPLIACRTALAAAKAGVQ